LPTSPATPRSRCEPTSRWQNYELPRFTIVHADLFRLGSAGELAELGLDDIADAVVVMECRIAPAARCRTTASTSLHHQSQPHLRA